MQDKPDTERIVDEAIGQAHGTPPPATEKRATSPEDAARQNAPAPGDRASMSEKTAASIGERVGNAYSDTGSHQRRIARPAAPDSDTWQGAADRAVSAGHRVAQGVSDQFSGQQSFNLIAAFGLGFVAAVLLLRHH